MIIQDGSIENTNGYSQKGKLKRKANFCILLVDFLCIPSNLEYTDHTAVQTPCSYTGTAQAAVWV